MSARISRRHGPTSDDRNTLLALYEDRLVGVLERAPRTGTMRFTYAPAWREASGAFPLSLSLPLAREQHLHGAILRVLDGYLPDRSDIREQLARDHQVAASDVFGLISALGEDCPGAIAFVRPSRREAFVKAASPSVAWLTEAALANRLRALAGPGAPARLTGDAGYFSLAGAQPKIALFEAKGRWGIPRGGTPTTHILKPPLGKKPEFLLAELIGLRLAAAIGLSAASAKALHVEDQWVLSVQRYDRLKQNGRWRRVHQEDICQALGVSPTLKYESTGAPGIAQIVTLLRAHSQRAAEDIEAFLDMIALNWIIVGTDAHARNYSVLIGAGGTARLAPCYDVATAYGVARASNVREARMAMQIGGEYIALNVSAREWHRLAEVINLAPSQLLARVNAVAQRVDVSVHDVQAQFDKELTPEFAQLAGRALTRITKRARTCAAAIG